MTAARRLEPREAPRSAPQRAPRPPRVRTEAETRLALRLAKVEAEAAILRGGLHAAAEMLEQQDRLLGEVGVKLLLGSIGAGDEEALALARGILARLRERAQVERVADRLADRLVLAEAALPALREAAEGTSRARVRDAVEALTKALEGWR